MTISCAIKFPQGTPATLITEAVESLPLFNRLAETNRSFLELEESASLLDLKEKLGAQVFSKLIKSRYPLAWKEINQKLLMAELKQNLERTGNLTPSLYNALLSIGMETAAALTKASTELATYLIKTASQVTGVSTSIIKALVKREKKGFNPLPTPKEIEQYQPMILVNIIKEGKYKNLVAEVSEKPDALGRVQVMFLKNNRKRTFFWWEIEPHQLITPDVEEEIPTGELEGIIKEFVEDGGDDKYYPLAMQDVYNIKKYAQKLATVDTEENNGPVKTKWKHLLEAIERYYLIPSISILQLTNENTPASLEFKTSQQSTGSNIFPEESLKLIYNLKNYWKEITAINQEIERSTLSDIKAHFMQIRHNIQCRFDDTLNALFSNVVLSPDEPVEYLVPVDETETMEYLVPVDEIESVDETEAVGYSVPVNELELVE